MALTATFVPSGAYVQLVSDGDGVDTATSVTVTRSVPGVDDMVVRGLDGRPVVGGVVVFSDNEAPLDATVTYTAAWATDDGVFAAQTATVTTTGAAWGLWVKAPGRADLNVQVGFSDAGDLSQTVQGGSWDIPGGGRVSESSGMALITTSLALTVRTVAQLAALRAVISQAPGSALLLQTGQPEELPSGYYQVTGISQGNPTHLRSDMQAYRTVTLNVSAVQVPAGDATGFAGVTHDVIAASFASHQAIVDADLTHLDLALGDW